MSVKLVQAFEFVPDNIAKGLLFCLQASPPPPRLENERLVVGAVFCDVRGHRESASPRNYVRLSSAKTYIANQLPDYKNGQEVDHRESDCVVASWKGNASFVLTPNGSWNAVNCKRTSGLCAMGPICSRSSF